MADRLFAKILVGLMLVGVSNGYAATEFSRIITWSQWPQYENSASVGALPQFTAIVDRFTEHPKLSIEIRYPGGETGEQWAQSFKNWLVSYGVPGTYIELFPGSGAGDQLRVLLFDRR